KCLCAARLVLQRRATGYEYSAGEDGNPASGSLTSTLPRVGNSRHRNCRTGRHSVKNASIFKPATYSVPNRFIPWVQEFSAATCELFGPHGMQNRAAEPLAARVESPDELLGPLLGSWELQTNATLPPYSDEYAELEQYLYARRRVNRN